MDKISETIVSEQHNPRPILIDLSISNTETSHMDAQSILASVEQLLSLNGWVAAMCPTLTRPFSQNKHDTYDDLAQQHRLYYFAIVIHSADHFLVDQLAVIVQMARRLGSSSIFVSMLDYDSTDSTETLVDLCEAVLTLLGVPFRIRKVPRMTEDPAAAYYPLEEAHMRNLALEPLKDLHLKRRIKFDRVIWLKGFTCPNDILENIKISLINEAAMVCGMDWAEYSGFFIFSDRYLHLSSPLIYVLIPLTSWRTRDINGDQFRQSKSSSKQDAAPPRDATGASRYSKHLPFQVFCCESGTHVVDPAQSYYQGINYRAGTDYHNLSSVEDVPNRPPDAPCLDSSQTWFCRDLWIHQAREGVREVETMDSRKPVNKRHVDQGAQPVDLDSPSILTPDSDSHHVRRQHKDDLDANVGSDFDAMPDTDDGLGTVPTRRLSVPNSVFQPARILINPRCVTTYAGVSHTQLALDLFGPEKGEEESSLPENGDGKYTLDDWEGAPESFVCQEQKYVVGDIPENMGLSDGPL